MTVLNKKRVSAALVLADGSVFPGEVFGYSSPLYSDGVLGEVVFNTSMTGYQEILTDPSYMGQIVVMTYPHIGNYGINTEDNESRSTFISGFVAHEFCEQPSNWRSSQGLSEYFINREIPAITGVDTRSLTRHLRDKGSMNALMVSPCPHGKAEIDAVLNRLKKQPHFGERDLVSEVTCKEAYEWRESNNGLNKAWNTSNFTNTANLTVAVLDLGVKSNMLRSLVQRGFKVKVLPASTSSESILKLKPHGLLLSNGPGDPARVKFAPNTVSELIGKIPIFGICMGHQILAHAIGAKTFKMKFGHHGANQPVMDLASGRVMITSQNHGYAIDPESLPNYAKVTQINLNDKSVEGIALEDKDCFSVQYHPEACPGPRDAMWYFDEFAKVMENA